MLVQVWLERSPHHDRDGMRAYTWGTEQSTGQLLAEASGASARAGDEMYDPADGFITAAILLQERVNPRVWLSVHPGGVSIRRLGEATLLE